MSARAADRVPQHLLGGLTVAILVADGFEQIELTGPRDALHAAGVMTRIVSPSRGPIRGFHHDAPADSFNVDLTFDEARADAFDGVLLPGGKANAQALRSHRRAQSFVRQIDKENKPLAVICHAPWLLVSAGLLEGRTLTSAAALEGDIRQAGATWVDEPAQLDGNWVSSRGPDDIAAFSDGFLRLLARRTKDSVRGTADDIASAAATGG